MRKKLLITGGYGFIGTNLILKLKNNYQLRILDNLSHGYLNYLDKSDSDIDFIKGDITNPADINKSLRDIDIVLHLAASGSVIDSVKNPEINFQNNVIGTFNLLNEMRKLNIKKLIFASTGGALIGNAPLPVDEESLPSPISPYGSSKLCAEAYFSSFASSYFMDITALRFANIIGPFSYHKKGAVTAFMKLIMSNMDLKIYGDGSSTRDYLYVDDLCCGIISALESKFNLGFKKYHLSSGHETSIIDLANKIIKYSPYNYNGKIIFEDKRMGEVERNFSNFDKSRLHLNFEPKFTIDLAITKTWQWYVNFIKLMTNEEK